MEQNNQWKSYLYDRRPYTAEYDHAYNVSLHLRIFLTDDILFTGCKFSNGKKFQENPFEWRLAAAHQHTIFNSNETSLPLNYFVLSFHLPAAYLCVSGWMWSRTPSLCLTYIRAASQMPVCLWWPRPSWTPAPPQNTALGRTHPPTSCFMPRTFPATRAGWRGELSTKCTRGGATENLH